MSCLSVYTRPREKVTDLLRKGVIVRVKKGLYVFGKHHAREPYSREVLANLIYGPSYVSLEYALQHYGLIPEGVEAVTSITTGRSKRFNTPVGLFTYRSVPERAYHRGIDRVELSREKSFLIAIPEKALADKLCADRGTALRTQRDIRAYLFENLRIEEEDLGKLDPGRIAAFAKGYRSRKLKILSAVLHQIGKRSGDQGDE